MEAELNWTSELSAGLLIGCNQIILRFACKCLKILVYFGSIMTLMLCLLSFASRDNHQQVKLLMPTQLYLYTISIAYSKQVWFNRRDEGK